MFSDFGGSARKYINTIQNSEKIVKLPGGVSLPPSGEKMELKINGKNIVERERSLTAAEAGRALDRLWDSPWVKASVSRVDYKTAETLSPVAEKLASECDVVVVIASGDMAKTLRAVLDAVPGDEDGCEVTVFGDTLSTADYDRLFTKLKGKRTGLIAVSDGKEPLELRGALAILKKFVVSEMGPAGAFGRIYAICSRDSDVIVNDAVQSEYQVIPLEEGITGLYAANSAAVILPLMVKGADISAYLEGFYDTVSSPAWDIDEWEYGAMLADICASGGKTVFSSWHKELESAIKWMAEFNDREGLRRPARMPGDGKTAGGADFDVLVSVENPGEDLMTPLFEGCNGDGSLNLLLNEESRRRFYEDERPGFEIILGEADASSAGQLAAFVQISEGIAEYFGGDEDDN